MKYEYNGHLTIEERINNISQEIIKKYPEIDAKTAEIIATLEPPITKEPNYLNHFTRLYNILFVIQKNKLLFNIIFKDLIELYQKYIQNNKDEKIDTIMLEIFAYINNRTQYLQYVSILT